MQLKVVIVVLARQLCIYVMYSLLFGKKDILLGNTHKFPSEPALRWGYGRTFDTEKNVFAVKPQHKLQA